MSADGPALSKKLQIPAGFVFEDLYQRDGLIRIDQLFLEQVHKANPSLWQRFLAARTNPADIKPIDESNLLIELAPHLDGFLGHFFAIDQELNTLAAQTNRLAPLYACKRLFVQRQAVKAFTPDEIALFDIKAVEKSLQAFLGHNWDELAFATQVMVWEQQPEQHQPARQLALKYAAWATLTTEGRQRHKAGILFHQPHKLDHQHLIHLETVDKDGVRMLRLPVSEQRGRDGFSLTDQGADLAQALDQANYCIWCHDQGKDSCSKGLRDRKTGAFQKSPFGVTLAGCPLEEKISEMHTLKTQGYAISALAVAVVDNPMLAATGHRICNDCMKSCIYQKQEPVNIPQVETRTLKDVLQLPWGFEVYSLLTRWNPLNIRRPLPKPDRGYKVLVVGLGPAGFTLSHHLMNDGHNVVAIDGLKIEPLPSGLCGIDFHGKRTPFQPIFDYKILEEDLDKRIMAGFGGVAEYGITVRWNKNFLKIIRLLLERRQQFRMFGGIRFGGTLTVDDAMRMGFDHIALCAGAGRPTHISMPNGLAKGVRMASDFLMALQLTGAARSDSIANLQIRLPVVVIGGGLTAIDTATESMAYYVRQVEKFARRYQQLTAKLGNAVVRQNWSVEDAKIFDEFLEHAGAIKAEREAARREKRQPLFQNLINQWGGVTVAYRRQLTESPSYTLNHEEVAIAMQEGIQFAEGITPLAVEVDEYQAAKGLKVKVEQDGVVSEKTLPARSILIAAGTQPNTTLAKEDCTNITVDGRYFQAIDDQGSIVKPAYALSKPPAAHMLASRYHDGRFISFFGDLHPSFFGNVVKAMGSAKQGYPVISRVMAYNKPTMVTPAKLVDLLNQQLPVTVHAVNRLTPTIIEVVLKAPKAAAAFQPGQFYRLQNYETHAKYAEKTLLAMEGLAMTGAWTDVKQGLISVIALEMGGSSDLCATLQPGEPVILMGPTGTPTEISKEKLAVLVGGGLGNAVLFSIGAALRAAGTKVLYFAGYKKRQDRYKVKQIEAAADVVVWCCDEKPGFTPERPQDMTFVGNIVDAMVAYAQEKLGPITLYMHDMQRLIAIGSDRMMAAVARARHSILAPYISKEHHAIGSINSPMQCMMKEICAQCLQTHRDPLTGKETVVFSCNNQDQHLDHVDWNVLSQRLAQNSVQEKITALQVDQALKQLGLRPGQASPKG
ncbi:MAG: FAD-dependent oxidoreductase [Alphaproteobacteria bacterium]|nr:FAD-dependent oxidoreductase [Alphaproteobacteria bacterium]